MSEGESKFKPMKAAGIRDWLQEAHKAGSVSEYQLNQIMQENEYKQERLKAFGLPTFASYGPKNSLAEVVELVPKDKIDSTTERFLVRCAPKDLSSDLKIERTKNITWAEVEKFIEQLPGSSEHYTVEVREDWNSDYGGTIIGDGAGSIVSEIVKGNLLNIEKKGLGEIKKGQLNLGDIHFHYQGDPTDDEKQIMIGALKYFVPDLDREKLQRLKLYTEYAYSIDHGYRFFEVTTEENQAQFWTKLNGEKTWSEPTGD